MSSYDGNYTSHAYTSNHKVPDNLNKYLSSDQQLLVKDVIDDPKYRTRFMLDSIYRLVKK